MGEFLAVAIGLTGVSAVVGLLVGKQDVAGELLLLCGVLVVIAAGREGWLRWRRRG